MATDTNEPEFFTVDDLAARWSLSASMIRKLIREGELRATHFGAAVRIAAVEAERFVRSRSAATEVQPTEGGGNVLV